MKSVEIIGFKRANLGKSVSAKLRDEGLVPSVVYGGQSQLHVSIPMIQFREIVYTPETKLIDLNIEGEMHKCILQDVQFHPVSETIVHADFLEVSDSKPVKMEIPLKVKGVAIGVTKGGKLIQKLRKVKVKALPSKMPDYLEVDVTNLDLGKIVRVSDIEAAGVTILNNAAISVASVEIPRALKGKEEDDKEAAAPSEAAKA